MKRSNLHKMAQVYKMYILADFVRSAVGTWGSYKNRNAQLYDIVRLAVRSGYCNVVAHGGPIRGPTMAREHAGWGTGGVRNGVGGVWVGGQLYIRVAVTRRLERTSA